MVTAQEMNVVQERGGGRGCHSERVLIILEAKEKKCV